MPTRSFAITADNQPVSLDDQGQGEITFTVANTTQKPIRGEARLVPLASTKEAWLTITGESERSFSPGESHQFSVRIAAPPGTPPGRYAFRLNMVSVHDPEGDYTEGPTVTCEICEAAPVPNGKRSFPWWLVVVLAVIVVGAGVAITLMLKKSTVATPDLIGKTLAQASNEVQRLELKLAEPVVNITHQHPPGTVIKQDPAPGTALAPGAEIQVAVEGKPEPVKVPDVSSRKNLTLDAAINRVLSANLKLLPVKHHSSGLSQQWNKVIDQHPRPGVEVPPGTGVQLTVATKRSGPIIFRVSPEVLKKMHILNLNTNRLLRPR